MPKFGRVVVALPLFMFGLAISVAACGGSDGSSSVAEEKPTKEKSAASTEPSDEAPHANLPTDAASPQLPRDAGGGLAPTIASMDPPTVAASSAPVPVAVKVTGSGFENGDLLDIAGTRVPTVVTSPTTLSSTIPADKVASAGTLTIAVVSPSGQVSPTTFAFVVSQGSSVTVTGLSPDSAEQWSGSLSLTVAGTGFKTDSKISFNGSDLKTTYQGPTLLTAKLSSSQLSQVGKFSVFVRNSNGDVSAPRLFTVEKDDNGGGDSCGPSSYGSCPYQDRGYCYTNGLYCGSDACVYDGYTKGCGGGGNYCGGGSTCNELGLYEGQCAFSTFYGWISCSFGCVYEGC